MMVMIGKTLRGFVCGNFKSCARDKRIVLERIGDENETTKN